MLHRFDTVSDAIEAGYERPGRLGRLLDNYEGYEIVIRDTSGHDSFGYDFGVKAHPSDELVETGKRTVGPFGQTVGVWTNDDNMLNKPGSVAVLFAPGELDKSIAEARAAIDVALA